MDNMTLGQRIAERRKCLGLSQEALGEKIEVSRQAISKWESDGAVPELDKIISLSRLFGVSVGWLLGIEEKSIRKTEDSGLSEEQMRMVEEIVRRYQSEEPGQSLRKQRRWLAAVICGTVAAVILLASYLGGNRRLIDEYSWQLSQLQRDYSILRGELSSLSGRLDQLMEAAEEQDHLLSDYSWEILTMNGSDHGRVFFTLIPKNWEEGATAAIVARRDGQVVKSEECQWDGSAYTGRLILPPENGYEYYFTVTRSGVNELGAPVSVQAHQRLQADEAENLKRFLQVACSAKVKEYQLLPKEGEVKLHGVNLTGQMPDWLIKSSEGEGSWTECDLVLYMNGEEMERLALLEQFPELPGSNQFHVQVDEAVFHYGSLRDGDELEVWLEVALSNWQTGRAFAAGWCLEDVEICELAVVMPT